MNPESHTDNWAELLELWQTNFLGRDESFERSFHSEIIGSPTLVIVAGDSWTWGGSLDPELRLKQIYGKLLSSRYKADWINIGCQGWSNSHILVACQYLLDLVANTNYNRIIVVLTLTENGRDVTSPDSHPYDYLKCFQKTGANNQFYEQVLLDSENGWIERIDNMLADADSRFEFFVGQNFVWHDHLYAQLQNKNIMLGNSNWIEILADYQALPRPIRTNLVCGWIFDKKWFGSVNDIVGITDSTIYKSWALPYIDRANLVNAWLDQSPINYKKQSKHPNADGHAIWANYIINQLEQEQQT
jgi:hypothetical protein